MVHAISHMVGAEYDTHHGLTNAIVLPAVLRFNAPAIVDKVPAMSRALGLAGNDFDSFERAIRELLDQLDIPRSLSEIGVPADGAKASPKKHIWMPRRPLILDLQMWRPLSSSLSKPPSMGVSRMLG